MKPVAEVLSALLKELGIPNTEFGVGMSLVQLDERDGALWDERARRITHGTATRDDMDAQNASAVALRKQPRLPTVARASPGPERPVTTVDARTDRAVGIGIPPLIAAEVAADKYEETPAMERVRSFYRERIGIMVLIGERGCGKSFAAAWWLFHAEHREPPIMRARTTPRRFVEADLLSTIDRSEQNDLATSLALVMDDLGTETDHRIEDVATLIARRYRNALPTIITTNLNTRDFGVRYGKRIMDRMDEVGVFATVGKEASDSLRARMRRVK